MNEEKQRIYDEYKHWHRWIIPLAETDFKNYAKNIFTYYLLVVESERVEILEKRYGSWIY